MERGESESVMVETTRSFLLRPALTATCAEAPAWAADQRGRSRKDANDHAGMGRSQGAGAGGAAHEAYSAWVQALGRVRQRPLPRFHQLKEGDERLNRLHAGVLPVAVHQLSRKRLGNTALTRDALPASRAGLTKLALQTLKGGLMNLHGPYSDPVFGTAQVPFLGSALKDTRGMTKTSRQVLAENLTTLMGERPDLDSFKKITAAGGPTNGTLDRIRRQESGCSIDQLDLLAAAYGCTPADLLSPSLGRQSEAGSVRGIEHGGGVNSVTDLALRYAKLSPAEQRDFLLELIAEGAAAPGAHGGKTTWKEPEPAQAVVRKIKTEGREAPRRKPTVLGDGS